jgi:hypothetical protein
MGLCIFDVFYLYNQQDVSYKIFFITVNALNVPGGFSARHQELKNCKHGIGYMSSLLVTTASVGEMGGGGWEWCIGEICFLFCENYTQISSG